LRAEPFDEILLQSHRKADLTVNHKRSPIAGPKALADSDKAKSRFGLRAAKVNLLGTISSAFSMTQSVK
jgi:hypothetical protein